MIKTFTYKLYKNKRVERKFYQWLGTCRYVYNVAKATKEYAYQAGVSLSKYDLIKQLPACKELDFVKQVNAQTLQSVIEQLDQSFQNFFKKNASYPKWASKHKWRSFGFKQGVRQTEKGFKLPKFGEVSVHNNREINGSIKTARLIKKADGIYLHITAEVEKPVSKTPNESQVGIDMGTTHFATLSDGTYIANPNLLGKQLRRLRIEQRSLSRKQKGSKRRKRQANVVARLYKQVADARKDFLHKLSTNLSNSYSNIAIEDLNITSMVKDSYLARQITDVSWGSFFQMLDYKADNLVKVEAKNTSRQCSVCKHISKENRRSQSLFNCVKCQHSENADLNAAKNIEARAFADSR